MRWKKKPFSSVVAIGLLVFHIFITAYIWFYFEYASQGETNIGQISLPITVVYLIAVTKWMIDNQDTGGSEKEINVYYGIFVIIIVVSFCAGLFAGPYLYLRSNLQPENLDKTYMFLESALGGIFALVFADMFENTKNSTKN